MSCRYDHSQPGEPKHFGNVVAPGFFADHHGDGTIHYCAHTDPEGQTTPKVVAVTREQVAVPAAASPSAAEEARKDG